MSDLPTGDDSSDGREEMEELARRMLIDDLANGAPVEPYIDAHIMSNPHRETQNMSESASAVPVRPMADRLDEIRARRDGIDLEQFEDSLTSVVQEMPCACLNGDDNGPATPGCLAADAAYKGGIAAILELKIKRADVGWLLEHIEQLQQEIQRVTRANAEQQLRLSRERDRLRAQREAVLDLCDAWLKRTPGERALAQADESPLGRQYHCGLVDGSATAIDRVRRVLGAADERTATALQQEQQ